MFFLVFEQRKGSQPTSLICHFCVIFRHIRTVTSKSSMWNIRKQGVLITRLLISGLGYSWWFGCTSTLLLLNLRLRLFSCSVLLMTKVQYKFRNSGFASSSFWQEWRRLNYHCNLSILRSLLSQHNCNQSVQNVKYPQTRSSCY